MNKRLIFLGTSAALTFWALTQSSVKEAVVEVRDQRMVQEKSAVSVGPPAQDSEESPKVLSGPVKEETVSKEIKEYREAAYALAEKIEKLGLDGDELNQLFNRVGKENFLKHVPEEIRAEYMVLEKKVSALGKTYLQQDGMTERFFTKYETRMPAHLERQRKALEGHRLPVAVEELVNKKIHEQQLNTDDIQAILSSCGRGNADCINKAFATLIDANHGLDDGQMELIREYL